MSKPADSQLPLTSNNNQYNSSPVVVATSQSSHYANLNATKKNQPQELYMNQNEKGTSQYTLPPEQPTSNNTVTSTTASTTQKTYIDPYVITNPSSSSQAQPLPVQQYVNATTVPQMETVPTPNSNLSAWSIPWNGNKCVEK